MPDPRTEIGELWRSVNREMHERFRQAFQGCDLPFGTLILLRVIKGEPGITVGELARRSGMVKSQVSKLVEQLVQQGHVQKQADPSDQRLVRITPVATATGSLAEMEARARAAWAAVVDEVPDAQLADVARGLQILLTALAKAQEKGGQG